MTQLYRVDSPINREQRNNINATFSDILIRFTNLKYQLSILAGGEDLEEIIQRIEDTISEANNTTANTQQVLNDITNALNQLDTALQNSDLATDNANTAALEVRNEITNLQNLVSQFGNAETYDNNANYVMNNIVEYNGSSYIALQSTTGNLPPTLPAKRNDFWQLLAQRGTDGSGSVSSVAGIPPDSNGNIPLAFTNIGAASNAEFNEVKTSFDNFTNNSFVNVKDFGALGDGVNDDTTAFQNAIDSLLQASVGGGTVFVPIGNYKITRTINMRTGVTLSGASPQGSRLFTTNNDITILTIRDDARVTVQNIRIDGAGATGVYGIALYDSTGVKIDNVWIDSVSRGVYINNTYFVSLENLKIAGTGIAYEMINAANAINMKNCYSITTTQALIWDTSSTLSITGCSFEGMNKVTLKKVQGASITGSYWEGMHEVSDIPTFLEVGGIGENKACGITITGNYFLIKAQHGITLYTCEGVNIEGNYFHTSVSAISVYQYDSAAKRNINIGSNSYNIGGLGYSITNALSYQGSDFDSLNTNMNKTQLQPIMLTTQKVPQSATIELGAAVLYWDGTNLMLKSKNANGVVTSKTVTLT